MKLAEALQERADLNRKIEQLKSRLNNNVLVQEGGTDCGISRTIETGIRFFFGAFGLFACADQQNELRDERRRTRH